MLVDNLIHIVGITDWGSEYQVHIEINNKEYTYIFESKPHWETYYYFNTYPDKKNKDYRRIRNKYNFIQDIKQFLKK